MFQKIAIVVAISLSFVIAAPAARACGCFAPPDPSVPVVQSGEKILFSVYNGVVTAQIQIQYQGDAKDFGWLLPLPSVPALEVGSDEVFSAIFGQTSPTYRVSYDYQSWCQAPYQGGSADLGAFFPAADGGVDGAPSPLVIQDSVGPYNYAVLKADDKTAMLAWLAANHYFVPAGTTDVIGPYLHPGAFFLALQLKSGQSAGDLQPIIVHYKSDLPMIPLVLTGATATANMNVWAFILGNGRAIPRNYYHVVLDDAAMNWTQNQYLPYGYGFGLPVGYEDLVAKAVSEAPGHHAFITELAGPVTPIRNKVFPADQFGNLDDLRKITDARLYLGYLNRHGYAFSSVLVNILVKYIKQPLNLSVRGSAPPTPANYYYNFDFWMNNDPAAFKGFDLSFDAAALTSEIESKVVLPVRSTADVFGGFTYFTRLHTRINPADMNRDPVFSWNPLLPDVSQSHAATMSYYCRDASTYANDGLLHTEQGFDVVYPSGNTPAVVSSLPATLRLELLREDGLPEVMTDNHDRIVEMLGGGVRDLGVSSNPDLGKAQLVGGGACSINAARTGGPAATWVLAIVGLATVLGLRRKRSA